MTSNPSTHSSAGSPIPPHDAVPEAEVKTSRGISIVWLVPIVAAAIGIWLAYTTFQERGPTITITFASAAGLEAGKTLIKYKDVEVGTVQSVRLSEDLQRIVVTAEMAKEVEPYMTDGTRFWVVSPRVSAGGVSGLGTLLSGVYIGADLHPGNGTSEFVGLTDPPIITSDTPGRHYMLRATTRGSIERGSPVYFRGIDVGQVVDYALADDNQNLDVQVFVQTPHDQLVHDNSRFWNAGGFRASLTASGVQVETESVQSLLSGGIAFDTPVAATQGKPSPGTRCSPCTTATTPSPRQAIRPRCPTSCSSTNRCVASAPALRSSSGACGSARSATSRLQIDVTDESIRIPVTIEIEPQRISFSGDR